MSLAIRQNEPEWLKVLGAARWDSVASRSVHLLRSLLDWGVLAAASSASLLGNPAPHIAVLGLLWLVLSRLLFAPVEVRFSRISATLMERFERHAFGMSDHLPLSREARSREEIVADHGRYLRYLRAVSRVPLVGRVVSKGGGESALVDWFPSNLSGSELRQALIAQRVGAEYSRLLAVRWARIAGLVSTCLILGVGLIAWRMQFTLEEMTLALLVPAAPVILSLVDATSSARAGSSLKARAVAKCDEVLAQVPMDEDLGAMTLELNSRLAFLWRTEGPGVPEVLYWSSRSRREREMLDAASQF